VASHLSVSITPAQAGITTGLTGGASAPNDPLGAFGRILDSASSANDSGPGGRYGAAGPRASGTGFVHISNSNADSTKAGPAAAAATKGDTPAKPDNVVDALKSLLPGATVEGDGTVSVPLAATTGDPTAPPAADDPTGAGTPSRLLRDLADALARLNQANESGQPVDKDLLKRVKTDLDALASFLATQPTLQAGLASAADPKTDATNAASRQAASLEAARASLAKLTDRLEGLATTSGKDQPELAAKLDALAKALDPRTLSGSTLTLLGLSGDDADPQLAAAINGFVNGKASPQAGLQPALAAPALKLPTGALAASPAKDKPDAVADDKPASHATTSAAAKPASGDGKSAASAATAKPDGPGNAVAAAIAVKAATDKPADAGAPAASPVTAAVTAGGVSTSAVGDLKQAQGAYLAAAPTPINLPQMAFEIARHFSQGTSHFDIRLDPPDMGRVDVRLAIDSTGQISAHLRVDRAETLDLLKRDAGALGQALTQAGLDGSKTNLQFSLNQNPSPRQDGGNGGSAAYPAVAMAGGEDTTTDLANAGATALYRGTVAASGLNIFV